MTDCIHHWYCNSPVNGMIHHKCLKCGEEKEVTTDCIKKRAFGIKSIHYDLPEDRTIHRISAYL